MLIILLSQEKKNGEGVKMVFLLVSHTNVPGVGRGPSSAAVFPNACRCFPASAHHSFIYG